MTNRKKRAGERTCYCDRYSFPHRHQRHRCGREHPLSAYEKAWANPKPATAWPAGSLAAVLRLPHPSEVH